MSEKKPHEKAAEATKVPDVEPLADGNDLSARSSAGSSRGGALEVRNPATWGSARSRASRSLRCTDTLCNGCGWSVTGGDEEEILGYLRSHARAAHGKKEFTSEEVANVRRAIQKVAA